MHSQSTNLKIAILHGGSSRERDVSLRSGKSVHSSLLSQGFHNAYLLDPSEPDFFEKLNSADVAFNALHGRFGEDGKIQGYLETRGIPFTGAGVLASALGMDKLHFKRHICGTGIPILPHQEIYLDRFSREEIDSRALALGYPLFLKPISEGGSLGAGIATSRESLWCLLSNSQADGYTEFLAERYVPGRFCTVGILQYQGSLKALPILEVVHQTEFYDSISKFDCRLHKYICPAALTDEETKRLHDIAVQTFDCIGCHGYARVDFVLDEQRSPFVLEINTLPGLSPRGNMAATANAAGLSYDRFILAILETAFRRPRYLP